MSTEVHRRRLPLVRGGCEDGPRPCPHVGCRYHLSLSFKGKRVYRERDPHNMSETCALDVAERGPQTQRDLGRLLETSHKNINQAERLALAKFRRNWIQMFGLEDWHLSVAHILSTMAR